MEHNHQHNLEHPSKHNEGHAMNMPPKGRTLKDFIPLVVIFFVVSLFTALAVSLSDNNTVSFAMQMFMAGFFLVFGAFKVVNIRGFVDAYSIYDLVAKRIRVYGYVYPFIELLLGIAYLVSWNLYITNIITVVVMTIGALGVFNELRKGNEVPCACLGTVFKIPMTWVTLIEDLLMAGMALGMLFLM